MKSFRFELPMWMEHLPGPALRRPPHRARRLPGAALLLDRLVAARSRRDRADDRLPCRRGGLALLPRRGRGRRPGRAAWAVRRLLRLALRVAGGPDRRRLRRRAADVHAAPPAPRDARGRDAARSTRSAPREDLIYADELGDDAVVTYTREAPDGWERPHGAHRRGHDRAGRWHPTATVFVCGSNGFVEAASSLALEAGVDASRIRTERFGPTGF